MRLDMGTFPVQKITFGSQTRYQDGTHVLRLSTWRLLLLGNQYASGPCVTSLNRVSRLRDQALRILASVVDPLRQ